MRRFVETSLRRALAVWMALAGLAFVQTALATIATFAWRYPTQDQFRLYRSYLELPFPASVLQIENQHRPIVPGLLRVAEIHLRDADQTMQIVFGTALALITTVFAGAIALRSHSAGSVARWAGFAACCIAIFWLGNARMLLHGNELVHTYLVTLCTVAVAACAWQATRREPLRWMLAGCAAAAIATFSFGPGIALFPTLAVLAFAARLPWRVACVPLAVCVVCVVVYVFVLPGNDNVRLALSFRPWDMLLTSTRWLASPWVNAWLSYADPPMFPFHAELVGAESPWLLASANAAQTWSGLTWSFGLALLLGGAGLAVLAAASWRAWREPAALTLARSASLAMMLFGAACAAIIGIARLGFMLERPDQVFADRYLPWPCLFWLGVALWLLSSRVRAVRGAACVFVALLPVLLWPTHRLGAGWGASVFRSVQATASAVRADVLDPGALWRDDPSVRFEDKLRALLLMRERGLAMFAAPASRDIGAHWDGVLEIDERVAARFDVPRAVEDIRGPTAAVRLEGLIERGIEHVAPRPLIVVLDSGAKIVGFGETAFDASGLPPPPWWPRRLQGVDLFVRDFDAANVYRVVALEASSKRGVLLGEFGPSAD